jgi:hypothetical protein
MRSTSPINEQPRMGHCPIWDCDVYAVRRSEGQSYFVGIFFRPTLGIWSPGTRPLEWWDAATPCDLPEGVEVPGA